ncbi:MAG TPA: hypothetical protein PKI61_03920 [bacterium]|nr:hypothetical protein [bacterium]HPT29774.1 hypothetical protein [bacterium]
MKKLFLRRLASLALILVFSLFSASLALAEEGNTTPPTTPPASGGLFSGAVKDRSNAQTQALGSAAGFNMGLGVDDIVSTVIGVALSILGIIFLVLIVVSGYQWMTAGGNEEQIKGARKRMVNAIIGLAIVLGAWAITLFIFRNLPLGGGGSGGGLQSS